MSASTPPRTQAEAELELEMRMRVRARSIAIPSATDLSRRGGIDPDPWQESVLESTAPQMILNCSRQSGKSQTLATLALHTAISAPRVLVLVLAPTQRQSAELMAKVQEEYRALGRGVSVDPDRESALQYHFDNGSRIVALPGSKPSNVRSFSGPSLIILDEAAFIPDELYLTVRPMLAVSHGRIVMASTPYGKRGVFYQEWKAGDDSWQRFEVPATECPRITAAFLAEEERKYGRHYVEREYLCTFHETDSAAFTEEEISQVFAESVEEWAL